ncbi:MAG: Phosphoadenylyl-sulfate reductase [Phycisphaerales bacterium]|nr:Phosphoadenylyl-sulfate reductase [Phycisphaerales bacterium]
MSTGKPSLDLPFTNAFLDKYSPPQIVKWAAETFGEQLIMTSSFGAESAILIHMAATVFPRIKIVMVDTGYLFPETHNFMAELRKRFDLNIWTYRTQNDPIRYLQDADEEDPSWRKSVEQCCGVNKNEPFDRAMKELAPAAWLRGIRRDQADTRKERQIVEWSKRNNCYAISPLLPWSGRDIGLYMKDLGLPYHPLVAQGYLSIGCNPLSCTRPVQAGEDPRAGRWSGQTKTECGLHVDHTVEPTT